MTITEREERPRAADPAAEQMLITGRFLFLHVPRTGGSFLRRACFAHLPRRWLVRNSLNRHTPHSEIAHDFADLPMFCLARNPWDWYVSWYEHLTSVDSELRTGPVWRSAFRNGEAGFKEAVTAACTGEGYENPRLGPAMKRQGIDHFSALFRRIAGDGVDGGTVEVGRFEHLASDFVGFAERHAIPLSEELRATLAAWTPIPPDPDTRYRDRYDDELREVVAEGAAAFVTAHDYSF